jgi:hypothetical protein
MSSSIGYARRAGRAIAKKIREAKEKIEVSVGVGDDESRFGGSGSRAWLEIVEEYKDKVLALLEKSTFVRFPRFEKFMRRLLGRPVALKKAAPRMALPPDMRKTETAVSAQRPSDAETERLKAEARAMMLKTHTHERAGTREQLEQRRRSTRRDRGDDDHS